MFALNRRISHVKQDGKIVEEFYDELHGLWQEIDFRNPNPMACACDIEKFNNFIQKTRVYTFLDGLDDRLDNIRAQVLQMSSFPSLEQAYAHVRRESNRQGMMIKNGQETVLNSIAMATQGYKPCEVNTSTSKFSNFKDKSKLKCSHCGGTRHTREQCFKIVGYPEWWKNTKKKQQYDANTGHASMLATRGNKAEMGHLTEPNGSRNSEGPKLVASSLAAAAAHTGNTSTEASGAGERIGNLAPGNIHKLNF